MNTEQKWYKRLFEAIKSFFFIIFRPIIILFLFGFIGLFLDSELEQNEETNDSKKGLEKKEHENSK